MDMETVVKQLEIGLRETKQDVKELQSAMVGSVDGTRKGFAQQLIAVMVEMQSASETMQKLNGRTTSLEMNQTRFEGTIQGAKTTIVIFWAMIGLASGIALTLLAKH